MVAPLLIVIAAMSQNSPCVEKALENDCLKFSLPQLSFFERHSTDVVAEKVEYVPAVALGDSDNHLDIDVLACFPNVKMVIASQLVLNLAHFYELSNIVELTVLGGTVSGMCDLGDQRSLRYLTLRGLNLNDEDTASLQSCNHLEYVSVQDNIIDSLKVFETIAPLRMLDVRGNHIADTEVNRFRAKRADVRLLYGNSAGWSSRIAQSLRNAKGEGFLSSRRRMIEVQRKSSQDERNVISFRESLEINLPVLGDTNAASYVADWMAVLVAYAQYFRDVENVKGSITESDRWFNWFVTRSGYPRSPSGSYSFPEIVQWVEKNKNDFAPSYLLDDALEKYHASEKVASVQDGTRQKTP